ncbi:MAG: hypothetical protein IT385_11280 [Deltaproteobacteria bacterium]|nr:hypothetical protein [Deltaproteobacteria bacterium]
MRHPLVRSMFFCTLALCAVPATARGDTTVTGLGVGTRVGTIDTHVDSVTYSDPLQIEIPGAGRAWEISGTVSGVGWGGVGLRAGVANRHYEYTVPFVARWPQHGGGKTLVMYHHGGTVPIPMLVQLEAQLGAAHVNRYAERYGDELAGLPTAVLKGTYIAVNRRAILGDGRLGAKYPTSEVTGLTSDEVNALPPHPDIGVGLPVPATISLDTATFRDVDRALQIVVSRVSGRTFRERIFVGTSAGAIVGSGMVFGCSVIAGECQRTGGNRLAPYDPGAAPLFDGFIFMGFPYLLTRADLPEPWIADRDHPLDAPVFFLQGRADERYQHPIRMAHDLIRRGVELDGAVWIYEIANQPHVTRDTSANVPVAARHAEPGGPYLGAALRNMRELLAGDAEPPASRIAGRIADGALVFDVDNGPTRTMPIREDALRDAVGSVMITQRTLDQGPFDSGATARWIEVTAALPHEPGPIVGPSVDCRIGYFTTEFFGSLFAVDDELLAEMGSFRDYRRCVRDSVSSLAAERLYDPRVERPDATAERYRALFVD